MIDGSATAATTYDYLIIGGGMAADSAARGIREVDATGSIGILAEEEDPPATRPALTKKLWTDPDFTFDQVWLGTEAATDATRHAGVRAVRIDREKRTVEADDGTAYGYGRLLLATGGTPRRLDLPDDDRVILFRSVEDYRRLRSLAGGGRRIAVVGGGFIGSELAAALVQNDTEVVLVFPEQTLGAAVFPAETARRFQSLFTDAGVSVMPGREVERGTAGDDGIRLELSDGDAVEAAAVVVGLGIDPNTAVAADAGLEVDGGVVVDDRLRTSDPLIFAAGDIAAYPDVILGRTRVEHVDNATATGTTAGRNLAGADERHTHTPYFYSEVFCRRYEAVGTLDASLPTAEAWDAAGESGVVYYLDGGRVVGVLLWNVSGRLDDARAVLADPDPGQAEDLRHRIPLGR